MKKTIKFSAIISILAILVCMVALMAPQVYAAEEGTLVSNPIVLQEGIYHTKLWTNDNYDLNCYNKITVTSRGYITFTIEKPYDNEGEIGSYDLQLYNQDGEIVWSADSYSLIKSFSDSYTYKIGLNPGVYYMNLDPSFYVYSDSAPIDSKYKYDFTQDAYWEVELNGDIPNATPINLNQMYSGVCCEESYDTLYDDYFSVSLTENKMYLIKVDNYSKLDAMIKFVDADGKESNLYEFDKLKQEGTVFIWLVKPSKTGTYYVNFDSYGNDAPIEYKVGVYDFVCEHTPKNIATCISKAVCSVCGEVYGEVDNTNHGYLDTVWGKDSTCTEPGTTDGKKCEDCGAMVVPQEVIAATGHKISKETGYPATCTENGLTDGEYCWDCYAIITEQTVIPATGHKEVTIPGKAASCTAKGLTDGKECSVCRTVTVAQKEIPVTAHKIVAIPAKKPTYTSTGLTAGKKCKTCGTVTVKQKKVAKKKLKKVTISTVKSTKAKQANVNWKTVSDSNGYIVEYSTSKKFTKKTTKKVTVKKAKSKKTTLKKLKSGKKYYIRIRAYKTVGKKTVYGAYSSVKTVKVK